MGFLAIRYLTLPEFGLFSALYLIAQMSLGLSRAVVAEPFMVRYSSRTAPEFENAPSYSMGASIVVGIVAGAGLAMWSAFRQGGNSPAVLVVAFALPFLLLQDQCRYISFVKQLPGCAVINDLVWLAVFCLGAFLDIGNGRVSLAQLTSWWVGSGALAAVVSICQLRALPRLSQGAGWIKRHADLSARFAAEFVIGAGASRVALLGFGALRGMESLGAFHGSRVIFGPVNILYLGIQSFFLPRGVRTYQSLRLSVRPLVIWLASSCVLVAAIWALVVFLTADHVMMGLIGENWRDVEAYLPISAVMVAGGGVALASSLGLRIYAAAKKSLFAAAASGALVVSLGLLGVAVFPAKTGAWGFAVAQLLASVVWLRQFTKAEVEIFESPKLGNREKESDDPSE